MEDTGRSTAWHARDRGFGGGRNSAGEARRKRLTGCRCVKGNENELSEGIQKGYTSQLSGITRKTLVWGEHTLLTEFTLAKDAKLPFHSHPQEQTGYLVKGHMKLTIGEETCDICPGDAWTVPGGVEHGASVLEDSIAIEVFSPVREDYLP